MDVLFNSKEKTRAKNIRAKIQGFRKAASTGTITIGFLTPWRIGPAGQLLPS
jgi:hypothetical protein